MKRPSAPDYRHDRVRWAGLIRDIHETAALPHENARRDLAERCAEARNTWLTAAAYPDGLIFPLMATAGLAWARSVEGEPRSRLLGVMLETASLADEALARSNIIAAQDRYLTEAAAVTESLSKRLATMERAGPK